MLILEGLTLTPESLLEALYENKVLVIRNSGLSNSGFLELAKSLGEVITFVDESLHHPEHKEIFVVSGHLKVGHYWHSDSSFLRTPQPLSLLWCQKAPEEGGETEFIDMVKLYEDLEENLKNSLQERRAIHDGLGKYILAETDVGLSLEDVVRRDRKLCPPVSHPVFITHPVTKKKALYVNPGFTTSLLDEDHEVLETLFSKIEKAQVLRHTWKKDDLVLWDNRSVVHRAYGATRGEREMFRLGVREGAFYV